MKKFLTLITVMVLTIFAGNVVLADGTNVDDGLMVGLQFSQETISRTTDINGGSYLYINPIISFSPSFAINIRYATDIAPYSFSDHIISVSSQFVKTYGGNDSQKEQLYFGLKYLTNFENSYYGIEFSPLRMNQESAIVEVFPVSFSYSPKTSNYIITFELMSLGFYFK